MPLQSINSWLRRKPWTGRPLPRVRGECGHPELHSTASNFEFSLQCAHPRVQLFEVTMRADGVGWLNGGCPCCRRTCLRGGGPKRGSSGIAPCQNSSGLPHVSSDYHEVTNAMTASLLGKVATLWWIAGITSSFYWNLQFSRVHLALCIWQSGWSHPEYCKARDESQALKM